MKKYFLIGLGVIVFCTMAVGDGLGVVAFLKERARPAAAATTAPAEAKSAPKPPSKPAAGKALFAEIPKFVVTIPGSQEAGGGSVYLQLSLSFLTEKKQAIDDFNKLMPIIKSAIISDIMASGLSPDSQSAQFRHKITTDSLDLANRTVSQADSDLGRTPFLGAYITTFVIQ
ncbi:flagellar basal body-associated protein FliL [uncultured Thioclava sp.]|uniref:flagellar basal body-associated FliL family protein n=1 Tax=uncultured Thioclava sp. TaxID=473858 RepID=UPI0025E7C85E|nr:flagellar basal body-associated FliL family protein [uncultured Thioclava sp.]